MDDQQLAPIVPTRLSRRSRRRVLQGLACGASGLLILSGLGTAGARYVAARDDDNSGPGSGNSGPGGGGADEADEADEAEVEEEAAAAAPAAVPGQVQIVDRSFQPATVTVEAGQSVTWINAADDEHTATGTAFDTGPIASGGSATASFATPGTFPYRCNFHPEMQGAVVVVDAAGNAPPAAEEPAADAAPAAAAQPGAPAVAIVDFAFEPATLSIEAGTSVVWTNTGQAPHTVTGAFADSGTIAPGGTFRHTFDQKGAFDYACSFHPQMVGRIEVAAESPALAVEPAAAPTGAWVVVLTPDADAALPPQQALLTFHADGTLAAVFAAAPATADDPTPTLSPGQGVWVAGDGGGYALTIVALLLDEGRRYAGTLTIHEEGELDDTGDTYRGTFSFEVVAADGGGPTTGGGTARGTRLGIGSVADAPPATPASEVAAAAPASATVTFQDFAFDPPTLEVPVGATVTWVNRGAAPHTATGTDGGFDTGQLDSGQRGSQTFDQAGTFAYRCNVHPQMEGTIVVA